MPLIKINKPFTREELTEKFDVEFPLSDWVQAQLGEDEFAETNRYDITKSSSTGDTWSVYLYMDEDSETVIAIDDTAQNQSRNYDDSVHLSPFSKLAETLLRSEEA